MDDSRGAKDSTGASSAESPELPTGMAFVLQLSRDTGPTLQPFTGRIEHLSTGRRVRFDSFEDFRAAVMRLLDEGKRR